MQVASESGREIKDVEAEVEELLEEIGHKMMVPAVRTLALPIRMTIRNVLHGVYVNSAGVEKVCREFTRTEVTISIIYLLYKFSGNL